VDPLVSADMNDLQDQIIAQQAGGRTERTRFLAPYGELLSVTFFPQYAESSASNGIIYTGLEVQSGERIKSIGLRHYGDGAADITLVLYESDGGANILETLTVSAPAAAWANSDKTLSSPYPVVANNFYYLKVIMAATAMRTAQLRVLTDIVP
jgi:hypothetical protein